MDLDNLRAFLAVAENGSFSAASNQLHLTQPAVSKRIAALEQELHYALFDRGARSVKLTQAGLALKPRAEAILTLLKETKQAMMDLSGDISGELRVATSHHLGLHKLPPVLRRFASLYPKVNLKFEFLDSEVAIDRVLRGVCELAVVTLPPESIERIDLLPVWEDPLVFVRAPSSADTRAAQHTSLADLSKLPAILPDLNTYTGRLVKACFEERGLPVTLNMTTNYLETIKMMVSVGLGWSVLPESMVDQNVAPLSIKDVSLQRTLGVAKHNKRHLSNAAEAFLEVLCAKDHQLQANSSVETDSLL